MLPDTAERITSGSQTESLSRLTFEVCLGPHSHPLEFPQDVSLQSFVQ